MSNTKNKIDYVNITNDLNHKLKNNQIDTTGRIDEKIERNRLNYIVNYIYDDEPEATENSDNFIFIKTLNDDEYILKKKKITNTGNTKEYSYYTINISLGTEIFVKYQKIEDELEDLEDRYILYEIRTEQDTKKYIYHKINKNEFDPSKTLHLTNETSLITDGTIKINNNEQLIINKINNFKEYADYFNNIHIIKFNDNYYLFIDCNIGDYEEKGLTLYKLNNKLEFEHTYTIKFNENIYSINSIKNIDTTLYIIYENNDNDDYGIIYFDYSNLDLSEDIININVNKISLREENNFIKDDEYNTILSTISGEFNDLELKTTNNTYIYENELYILCKSQQSENNTYYILCKLINNQFEIENYYISKNSFNFIVYKENNIYNYVFISSNYLNRLYLFYGNKNLNDNTYINNVSKDYNSINGKQTDTNNSYLCYCNNKIYLFVYGNFEDNDYGWNYRIYELNLTYNTQLDITLTNYIITDGQNNYIISNNQDCITNNNENIYLIQYDEEKNNYTNILKLNLSNNTVDIIKLDDKNIYDEDIEYEYRNKYIFNDGVLINYTGIIGYNVNKDKNYYIYLYKENLDFILNINNDNLTYKKSLLIDDTQLKLGNNIIVDLQNNTSQVLQTPNNDLDIVNKKYVDDNSFDPSKTLHLTNEKSLITDGSIQILTKDETLPDDVLNHLNFEDNFKNISYVDKFNNKYYLFTFYSISGNEYNNDNLHLYILDKSFNIENTYILRFPKINNETFYIKNIICKDNILYILYNNEFYNISGIIYIDYSKLNLTNEIIDINIDNINISLYDENNFYDNTKFDNIISIVNDDFNNLKLHTLKNTHIFNNNLYLICKFNYNNNSYFVLCKLNNNKYEIINYFGQFDYNNDEIFDFIVYNKDNINHYCYIVYIYNIPELRLYYSNGNMTDSQSKDITANRLFNEFISDTNLFNYGSTNRFGYINDKLYVFVSFNYESPDPFENYYKIYQLNLSYIDNILNVNCIQYNINYNNENIILNINCFAYDDKHIYILYNYNEEDYKYNIDILKINMINNSIYNVNIETNYYLYNGVYFYGIFLNNILLINNDVESDAYDIYLYYYNLEFLLNTENNIINLADNIIINKDNNTSQILQIPKNNLDIVNKEYVDNSIDSIDSIKLTINDNPDEDFY